MYKKYSIIWRVVLFFLTILILIGMSMGCAQNRPHDAMNGITDNTTIQATPHIWKVSHGESYLFLFGSIHVAQEELYPLNEMIMNTYASCDYLALETNPSEFQNEETIAAMASFMRYTDGTKIMDIIGEDLFDEMIAVLKKEFPNLNSEGLESCTPMMFLNLLQIIVMDKTNLSDEYGIDLYFYNAATKDGKSILSVEPYELQMQIFSDFSSDVNKYMLEDLLDVNAKAEETKRLYAAWIAGDADSIIEYELLEGAKADMASKEELYVYNRLGIDRSLYMADVAEGYVREGKNVFFVVGAAHMLGEQGIVSLLQNKGYKVELLSYQ